MRTISSGLYSVEPNDDHALCWASSAMRRSTAWYLPSSSSYSCWISSFALCEDDEPDEVDDKDDDDKQGAGRSPFESPPRLAMPQAPAPASTMKKWMNDDDDDDDDHDHDNDNMPGKAA